MRVYGISIVFVANGVTACKVNRWWGQYLQGLDERAEPMPEMKALMEYLRSNIPPSDSKPAAVCIAHGDFRLDNLVFKAANEPNATVALAAILDWELSTLGDPLSDLAYCCQPYYLPAGLHVLPTLPRQGGRIALPEGIPSEVVHACTSSTHSQQLSFISHRNFF